ncbi:MAG: hypothetical protein JW795_20465, partial [Chitinivibrionales bacterium]|nr:hypothetical protein [Chitinivibrionales bacterium]
MVKTGFMVAEAMNSYRWAILITLFLAACATLVRARSYSVTSVLSNSTGDFNGKSRNLRYELDVGFDTCPQSYWGYLDQQRNRLIIEFFDIRIEGSPRISILPGGAFRQFSILNDTVKYTQTNLRASLLFDLNEVIPNRVWQWNINQMSSSLIRISMWKEVSKGAVEEEKNKASRQILFS